MLKLAINAVSAAPGGGLNSLLGYLSGWKEIGADLDITLYASREKVIDSVRAIRPDIKIIPYAVNQPPHKHFLLQQFHLGKLIEASGADVVFNSQCALGRCSVPQVIHHENLWRFRYPGAFGGLRNVAEFIRDKFSRFYLRTVARNVFISNYLRDRAEMVAPESASRNHVIHLGISRELLEAARNGKSTWSGRPHLVALTSDTLHKDNATLLRTLKRLIELEPSVQWELSIAGSGEWIAEKELARELGIADRVRFCGYLSQTELDALMRDSLCQLLTSRLEAFGLPLIEGMARCCPSIASNVDALPEVAGNAALLVEPGNVNQFAAGVLKLYHDRDLRESLVNQGLSRVQRFRWTDSAARMLRIIQNSVNEAPLPFWKGLPTPAFLRPARVPQAGAPGWRAQHSSHNLALSPGHDRH